MTTKIEWAEESWNLITGCSPVSEGCANCYAERMAQRLKGRFGYPKDEPFRVVSHSDRFEQPLRWKKPKHIFVCSMSDFAHEKMPMHIYRYLFFTMYRAKRHTFLILTKRPDRMAEIIQRTALYYYPSEWPFANIYLGITAENQTHLYRRVSILAQIPAAKRFVSLEPLLGPVDLCVPYGQGVGDLLIDNIDWVIAGCESGPKRRQAKTQWFRDLKNQCVDAGIPFFLKQTNGYINGKSTLVKLPELDGKIWEEKP